MGKPYIQSASTMLIVSGSIAIGAPEKTSESTITMVTELAEIVEDNYVYPELGQSVSTLLLANLEKDLYAGLDRNELASALRRDMIGETDDLHFGVRALPENWAPPSVEDHSPQRNQPQAPYGFQRIERLSGNIGYIDLRGFTSAGYIEDTLESAMQLVQGSRALIFDMRYNGGGDPAAVQLVTSYLFDPEKSVHLNSLYFRPTDTTTEFWTHNEINTELAMPDIPVYVLTSGQTFSAAEEFTYNLQNLERATIVGETTGGGAHPVNSFVLNNELMAIVPIARAINPITGTNWEGTGVVPDIEIHADAALEHAIGTILEVAYESGDESVRWGLAHSRAKSNPIDLSANKMLEYAGTYSDREIRVHNDSIEYRRMGAANWRRIVCAQPDLFVIPEVSSFLLEFERNAENTIVGIRGHYQQGHQDYSPRNES